MVEMVLVSVGTRPSPVGQPQDCAAHPDGPKVALVHLRLPLCLAGIKQLYQSIAQGHIVHKNIIHPDEGLPHRSQKLWHPLNLSKTPSSCWHGQSGFKTISRTSCNAERG